METVEITKNKFYNISLTRQYMAKTRDSYSYKGAFTAVYSFFQKKWMNSSVNKTNKDHAEKKVL